jgi:hypothetical protein
MASQATLEGVPRRAPILALRYGLPALLIVAGFVILFTVDSSLRWDGWAMCVGAGLSISFMNILFRIGAKGDRERDDEAAAREYLAKHGHWPDEAPPRRGS